MAAAAACSGGGPAGPEKERGTETPATASAATAAATGAATAAFEPLTDRERGWVRRYAGWRDEAEDPFYAAARIRDRWRFILLEPEYEGRPVERYARLLAVAGRCAGSLERRVGKAPTEKLADAFELLRSGCELLAEAAASDGRALEARDPAALDATESDWEEALLRLEKADDAVERLLLSSRPLPRKRGVTSESRVEPVFADAIGRVVVENQQVRCWSKREWPVVVKDKSAYENEPLEGDRLLGFSRLAEPLHLSPRVCEELAKLRYAKERPRAADPRADMAEAILVLAHESEHSVGTVNEAVTECRALQRVRAAARLLGASKPYADLLATAAWEDVYPYAPPEYRTDRCYDRGPLDLRPRSSAWP